MGFERIIGFLKDTTKPKDADFVPSDPIIEFPHPENASLFTRFRKDSKIGIPGVMGGYEIRTHPDLTSIFYKLINDPGVRKGYAYGRPVISNSNGLVFAYANGTHYVFLKLHADKFEAARQDGGRFDPSYGKDWVEFRLGGRFGASTDWEEAMQRWANISYQGSMSIE